MTPDHCGARPCPSPNHGPRRGGAVPDLIVLHHTGMPDCADARARLCDAGTQVSAHYLVSEAGEVWQLVAEARRAWHAGAGCWGAVRDVNSHSIGIELANPGDRPFPEPQMAALERLLADVMMRRGIPAARVIAHADMAPGRKSDPGARFDWRRLALSGLSVWPQNTIPGGAFLSHARAFGYTADVDEAALLAAFRLRFRPWASGPADATDTALAADLARRFPVDRTAPDT
ncbi:MAG: N-acetylmuramoyl-L-alanine amidase [Roseovarius sp.]|nr:N-acetylmuramoyl-L-alanine amidase [Roseovarius sp.]